ncbi:hypothetical protein IWY39_002568 [Sphingobium sp. JAI105]|uniref:hypothetical protein n=1 Tax=Sphingobium sp. JAI105 TaxID=2787715 RepID=UPI0018CA4C9F|nr:hypothetical protein [Sphingobium sp. JAI105]MBG6116206.1 hypothetical protein [Sphingobium sp. JAI105]MBG6118764.1 hypothetical protein [Sphingobium sp. JAI105]
MKFEDIILWLVSLIGGLAMVGARLGWMLFGVAPEPPDDPVAFGMWQRKRRWLIFSELSALPAFAMLAVMVGRLKGWPDLAVILFAMALGGLGFAFLLDALQFLFRKRLGIGGDVR